MHWLKTILPPVNNQALLMSLAVCQFLLVVIECNQHLVEAVISKTHQQSMNLESFILY